MLLFQACYLSCYPQGTPDENRSNRPVYKAPEPVKTPPPPTQGMELPTRHPEKTAGDPHAL